MAEVYTCQYCGADLTVSPDGKTGTCAYCGSSIVFPHAGFRRMNRANELRQRREFDQAEAIYRSLTIAFPDDPEVWWNIVLCEYGIEYVQEGSRRIPTINRMKYESVFQQEAYQKAISLSDESTVALYRAQAQRIADIQAQLQTIVAKEDPYDIFICFKDRDAHGERTLDSALAQDIYDALTKEGYKVFFSRITLRTAVGQAYEPRIFAALNSARMMIVVACAPEHLETDWVKNEWSRYLKLMEKDADKYLLPICADMDLKTLPPRLANLEGIAVSGPNYMNRILKNVADRIGSTAQGTPARLQSLSAMEDDEARRYTRRGNAAIDSKKWDNALSYFEQALRHNTRHAPAWWGKLRALTRDFTAEGDFRSDPDAAACWQQAMEHADRAQRIIYDDTLRQYQFQRLMADFLERTSHMQQVWTDADSDKGIHQSLVAQQAQILELADESRKEELTAQFAAYNQKQGRVQALKREYDKIEQKNQELADNNQSLVRQIRAEEDTLAYVRRRYPVKLYWFLTILLAASGIGLVFLVLVIRRYLARNDCCMRTHGCSAGELESRIPEDRNRLEDLRETARARTDALPDIYGALQRKYEDVADYVIPHDLTAHIRQWRRRMMSDNGT